MIAAAVIRSLTFGISAHISKKSDASINAARTRVAVVTVAGRRSPRSLYRQDVVTFEADSVYRQKDAEGFIRLNALRLRIRALRDRDPSAPA